MHTLTPLTPLGGINLTRPSRIMEQLAEVEETLQNLVHHHLEVNGIDLREPVPIIIIDRPHEPISLFQNGYTLVRPQTSAPLYGQAKIGGCYIRWEEELL